MSKMNGPEGDILQRASLGDSPPPGYLNGVLDKLQADLRYVVHSAVVISIRELLRTL
jgi:hypothetical protein